MGRKPHSAALESRVRRMRLATGMPQQELAKRIGLTRQALSAIEAGTCTPNTVVAIRLARALRCRIEDLFILDESVDPPVELWAPPPPGAARLTVASVRGRLIAHPLDGPAGLQEGLAAAEALLTHQRGKRQLKLLVRPEQLEKSALLLGCDPALGILCSHLARKNPDLKLQWLPASSRAALDAVSSGGSHVAGSHIKNHATGDYNIQEARDALQSTGGLLVAFTSWEQGFVVQAGNPKRIRSVEDLTRPDVCIINRDTGAGTRVLLDELLSVAGIPIQAVRGYARESRSHFGVARTVVSGGADVGIALRAAATAFGLGFVPLVQARFDFVIPRDHLDHPVIRMLLEMLQTRHLTEELSLIAGYDVSRIGTVVANIRGRP